MRAQKIALLMGGTLSKTEINSFQHTFNVLALAHLLRQRSPKCWLCPKSDHVAAGLNLQQVLLGGLWVPSPQGCKMCAKLLHEVSTKFCNSYGAALRTFVDHPAAQNLVRRNWNRVEPPWNLASNHPEPAALAELGGTLVVRAAPDHPGAVPLPEPTNRGRPFF